MNARRDPDRLIHAFLLEGQTELADQVYDAVRATIEDAHQRAVIGPWRMPTMNTYAKFAAAAVAVIAIGALGLAALRPGTSPGVGGQPTDSPSMSPPPTASPSASPAAPTALTETFTSERYGFSIMYPAGWVTRPATEPWTSGIPDFVKPDGDVIYHPTLQGDLWIMVASQPLGGKGEEPWVDDLLTELISEDFCDTPLEDVAIDGAQGRECASSGAAVSAGDRGYLILLYVSGDDSAVGVTYDRAWFEEILATVQIRPENAVDMTPSGTP
jgi:hypothetical protein